MRGNASCLVVLDAALPASMGPGGYDPMDVPKSATVRTLELDVRDGRRDRVVPILVYLPERTEPSPVVLFSHGLGGTRYTCRYLGEHWAKRGYVGVFLQHPGSDSSVWQGKPLVQRMPAMREASTRENLMLRIQDVSAVLDQLQRWNGEKGHALGSRLDMARVGMSGHSFGARTTQAVSGQSFGARGPIYTDRRTKAALILSPSTPFGADAKHVFGKVAIPWMLMTGTRDLAPIGDVTVESRLAVYGALPPGDKYELVLHDAEHSAFTDRGLLGDRVPRNPNHHRAILALSTAFWDAYLGDNAEAKRWLQSDAVRSVLESRDRWQHK